VYIKEESEKQSSVCNLSEVKDVAVVITNHGRKLPSQEPVHLPPEYGNQLDLQSVFPGMKICAFLGLGLSDPELFLHFVVTLFAIKYEF